MQQCMLGVLYYPGTQHALRHETFHHCWDSYADCWCLCGSQSSRSKIKLNALYDYNILQKTWLQKYWFHFVDSQIYAKYEITIISMTIYRKNLKIRHVQDDCDIITKKKNTWSSSSWLFRAITNVFYKLTVTAVRGRWMVRSPGTRDQLKQILISIMVTTNFINN